MLWRRLLYIHFLEFSMNICWPFFLSKTQIEFGSILSASRYMQLIDYDHHTLDQTTIKLATTIMQKNGQRQFVDTNNSNHNWFIDFICTHFNCLFYYFYGFVELDALHLAQYQLILITNSMAW